MRKSDPPPVAQGNEHWIMLGVLKAIEENDSVSQRSIAKDVGIALGLANTYLKRCVKKGLIKVRQTPANRYAYYLTPRGFSEKSRLTAEYLSQSLKLFRLARHEAAEIYANCKNQGWHRIALVGTGDLAEIFTLSIPEGAFSAAHLREIGSGNKGFDGVEDFKDLVQTEGFDAVIICDLHKAQDFYDVAVQTLTPDRVLSPGFLGVSRERNRQPRPGA